MWLRKSLFKILVVVSLAAFSWAPLAQTSYASNGNSQREFIMSCTYGVLAGTLIGAASLAFVDHPSDHLNKVARGASLGLYAGILLGLYVIYVVPAMAPDPYDNPLLSSMKLQVQPTANVYGAWDGAEVSYRLLDF
jgi:hypothetical protein